MEAEKDIYILAIESSCDETAASVVKNGREVLSNVISTQIALHTLYGGVVPEIASRKHIEKINQVIEAALQEAGQKLRRMDAIAVTYGPGLVGALLVGPQLCHGDSADRCTPYRRTYQRQLYRTRPVRAALHMSGGVRRAFPSGGGEGLRRV